MDTSDTDTRPMAPKKAQARAAALRRWKGASDPETLAAEAETATLLIEKHIAATVARYPRLSDAQRDRVLEILRTAPTRDDHG